MAEPVGSLVVRIGGDATDLLDAFRRAGKATEDFSGRVEQAVTAVKGLAAAFAIREVAQFVSSIAEADDQLGKMAQKVGLTVEQMSELKYAARLSDLSLEQLGTGLKQLSKFMVENGEAGQSVEERLFRIAEQFSKMPDGATKTALAMQYFGRTGADLIPVLNEGAAGLRAHAEEARKLGLVLSEEAAKAASEFNDNVTRVKEIVSALSRELSGPLIKALGDTAGAFVQARRDGESFFAAMASGMQRLLTGSDADKWAKDFTAATDRLLQAQNALDQAKNLTSERGFSTAEAQRYLADYVAQVAQAQAAVDKLKAIKPILAPEEAAAPGRPKSGGAGGIIDHKADEALAKQLQEGVDEEQKMQSEALAATVAFRDAQLAKEKEFVDGKNAILIQAFEDEQNAAIAQGEILLKNDDLSHATRLEMLRGQHDAEYAENERHRLALADLDQTFSDAELNALGGRNAVIEKLEAEHNARILNLRRAALTSQTNLTKNAWLGQTATVLDAVTEMTSGVTSQSRALFEINKIASIANIAVKTPSAIASAYEFGVKFGGPPLGAAMAALAGAAMAAQAAAAASASFGGGSAPSIAGTTPAPAVTPVQQQSAPAAEQTTIIHLPGTDLVSTKTVRELLKKLNENNRNGGKFLIA